MRRGVTVLGAWVLIVGLLGAGPAWAQSGSSSDWASDGPVVHAVVDPLDLLLLGRLKGEGAGGDGVEHVAGAGVAVDFRRQGLGHPFALLQGLDLGGQKAGLGDIRLAGIGRVQLFRRRGTAR